MIRLSFTMLIACALFCFGCGPGGARLVNVEGEVTLDGHPVEGATVLFRPAQGRPSAGKTNSKGRYVLRYTAERLGAVPGMHSVAITTMSDDDDDEGAKKESIPARYNRKSELRVEVASDTKEQNFELQSK